MTIMTSGEKARRWRNPFRGISPAEMRAYAKVIPNFLPMPPAGRGGQLTCRELTE